MRRILGFYFAILALTVTGLAAQESGIAVSYERLVLPNGLNVILHEDHTTPMVAVNVWYHVGSGREQPGRTGFAHLFEHIMFEGSGHVAEGKFDEWLEAAGGVNNGSTNTDRTNYFETVPNSALELALFLESDRMGYLLDAMSPAKVDGQRDVVKNERRFRIENRPYGQAFIAISENLYPPDHPYHWPVIGSMEDLTAASYEDVVQFHQTFYVPSNASLSIAGDIDPEQVKRLVQHWFGDVAAGAAVAPLDGPAAYIAAEKRVVMEDRVQLPRIYMCWLTPRLYAPGDAELDIAGAVLSRGKNSRLYKRLVYDMQIAQNVSAFQSSAELGSEFCIMSTARSGHDLNELEAVIQEELDKLKAEGPTGREVQRAINQYEAGFLSRMESLMGKADQLNGYYFRTGNPDYFNEDLARYRALDPADVQSVVKTQLRNNARVILSIVPQGKPELAASKKTSE
ncbi:MAG: insulinase family protein [Gemmatimonadales bacterium]|nr:insulinase family protein [Gemmatimonadales bacterium]NIN11875.1 insulinase family protein [Gemmatimonadales bacterium]NIN50425.1 insulinase family protein [Gemmatimonadales bacterium]NIP07889.1 insulinase family protein [Gemmatimonadales bacterium]NIR01913.1 insulinase family protein [Gemmatimonadales bacterium]